MPLSYEPRPEYLLRDYINGPFIVWFCHQVYHIFRLQIHPLLHIHDSTIRLSSPFNQPQFSLILFATMFASTIICTLFAGVAMALPTSSLHPRAGGPAITPIPSSCAIYNPVSAESPAFIPSSVAEGALLYSAYYPSNSADTTEMAEQCLEQCYGYGYHTECKASYWAENVVIPEGYRGAGQLSTACLLYTRALSVDDFVIAPEGQGTSAYTRNLAC